MVWSCWVVPVLVAMSGAMHAAQDRFAVASDAQSFYSAAASLRTELASDHLALSADERRAVDADLRQMQRLVDHYGSPQSLNLVSAVRYFNAEQHLDGLLAGDLAQRRECMVLGNRAVCGSYGWMHAGARNNPGYGAEFVNVNSGPVVVQGAMGPPLIR